MINLKDLIETAEKNQEGALVFLFALGIIMAGLYFIAKALRGK